MALTKQAKTLSKSQISAIRQFLRSRRNGLRNEVMFMLSVKAGLRAKEIAKLKWIYLLNSNHDLSDVIELPNIAAKGNSGRQIPINKDLKSLLSELYAQKLNKRRFDPSNHFVVTTERSESTSPQAIVNFFSTTYRQLGLIGCSSHSGRRTFITNAARKISTVDGSLRDVQMLAGHSSLQTTQRYIDVSSTARNLIVNLI